MQEFLERPIFGGHGLAESGETPRGVADVFDALHTRGSHCGLRVLNQVCRQMVEDALGGFIEFQFLQALRVGALDLFVKSCE